ncbi:MAG: MBL fold metallo-hydrolase [Flavobacterium sp.]|nr:MAG: MBL fold metallo-hydrolase [Flavobacterium sp.]
MKYLIVLLSFLLLMPLGASGQTDGEEEGDSRIVPVRNKIYLYKNRGGNIGLCFGDDGVFMIDTQFEDISEDLLKDIRKFTKEPIKYVLNTHHHGDHTGGNSNMANEGATIIAHENVRTNLINAIETSPNKIHETVLPKITIGQTMTFYLNREEIVVRHLENAHTDGDVLVHFTKSNVIHTGDTFFAGKYPYIDVENGGTVSGYMEGLELILGVGNRDTKFIPGHGNVSTFEDVKNLKLLLENVYNRVKFQHLNGKNEQQILAMSEITADYDRQGYGDGFITTDRFLKTIYDAVAFDYNRNDRDRRARQIEDIRRKQNAAKANKDNKGDKGDD